MIGLGLLEAVPEEQILANADPDDANKDGISGKPNQVWSREHQKADARPLRLEGRRSDHRPAGGRGLQRRYRPLHHHDPQGLGRLHREGEGLSRRAERQLAATIRTSRSATICSSMVVFYSKNLAVPARRKPDDPEVLKGKAAVLPDRLRQLPQAEIHDRRRAGPAAFVASVDLSLHRYAAPRHGRGTCRRSARGRGERQRMAHARRCGASGSPAPSTATPCFCMTAARATSPRRSSGMAARRQAARDKFAALSKADRDAPRRLRELAVSRIRSEPLDPKPLLAAERATARLLGSGAIRRRGLTGQRRDGPRGDRQGVAHRGRSALGYAALAEPPARSTPRSRALCKEPSAAASEATRRVPSPATVDGVEQGRDLPLRPDHRRPSLRAAVLSGRIPRASACDRLQDALAKTGRERDAPRRTRRQERGAAGPAGARISPLWRRRRRLSPTGTASSQRRAGAFRCRFASSVATNIDRIAKDVVEGWREGVGLREGVSRAGARRSLSITRRKR